MIDVAEQRIERILSDLIAVEGGYVNDAADRGGETRWGITAANARAHGYTGPMATLPQTTARAIYRATYVDAPRFGEVVLIDPDLGAKLVDIGVNMGPAVAATFLQRWLNAFNDTGTHYAALVVDGQLGVKTLDALRAFLRWRGPMGATALLKGINSSQGTRYLDIAEGNHSQRRFVFGWIIQRMGR